MAQYREQLTSDDFREGLWHTRAVRALHGAAGPAAGRPAGGGRPPAAAGIKVFQTIFASTLASSVAVTSVIFLYLLNPVVGVFQVDWLTNPDWAMFAVSLSSIWQNLGLSFIIVLAGLQAVPEEVMEAATLDGYGPVRRLLADHPAAHLAGPAVPAGGARDLRLQAFAQIDIITDGGPAGATETLVFKINRLIRPDNIGIGAVYSVGLFFITLVVTAVQFLILERRVHYAR